MSITTPEPDLPENFDHSFSYEHGVDILIGDVWQPIRFISEVAPTVTPVTQDAATYEDLGSPNAPKVSESWTLGFYIQANYVEGAPLPELAALVEATGPDAVGPDASRLFRWYDKPSGGRAPDPNQAFMGRGTVELVRAATGADGQIAGFNVTVTGQGRRTKIANPLLPPVEDEEAAGKDDA